MVTSSSVDTARIGIFVVNMAIIMKNSLLNMAWSVVQYQVVENVIENVLRRINTVPENAMMVVIILSCGVLVILVVMMSTAPTTAAVTTAAVTTAAVTTAAVTTAAVTTAAANA